MTRRSQEHTAERRGLARLRPFQADLTALFRLAVQLIFNLLIVIILIALFIGVGRVFLNLTFTLSQSTVPNAFNVIVSDVLALLVVIELFRSFVEYFDHRRVRIHVLVDVALIFVLRELIIGLYSGDLHEPALLLAYGAVLLALGLTRTLVLRFSYARDPLATARENETD
ncbi:phosphate-starvation-inducible PsiE family protein [Deinococcus sp. YIM 77859]|uniref:phosphate-starvation-inducible PsiE family protein n=1 Tax=Deinococcus sp. YIM 77859 TaxID=1540221 RepID=UPI000689F361|nr:phosphate-starvation-inducible PsiE family protein [Deinococcus sp. YIM 77859]